MFSAQSRRLTTRAGCAIDWRGEPSLARRLKRQVTRVCRTARSLPVLPSLAESVARGKVQGAFASFCSGTPLPSISIQRMTSPDLAAVIESHVIPQWIEDTSTDAIVGLNKAARALLGVDSLAPGTTSSRWLPDYVRSAANPATGWIPGIALLLTANGSRQPVRLFTCQVPLASGEGRLVVLLPPEPADSDT